MLPIYRLVHRQYQEIRVDQPHYERQFQQLVEEAPKHMMIMVLLSDEAVGDEVEDALGFPEERVDDPVGEPLDERLLVLLDLQQGEALPHGVP